MTNILHTILYQQQSIICTQTTARWFTLKLYKLSWNRTKQNALIWKAQILFANCKHQLMGRIAFYDQLGQIETDAGWVRIWEIFIYSIWKVLISFLSWQSGGLGGGDCPVFSLFLAIFERLIISSVHEKILPPTRVWLPF